MISFLSGDSPLREGAGNAVSRVRDHLKIAHKKRDGKAGGEPRRDLKTLLARLAQVRSRGGPFAEVELGPAVADVAHEYQVVGSEMLMLMPERRGA